MWTIKICAVRWLLVIIGINILIFKANGQNSVYYNFEDNAYTIDINIFNRYDDHLIDTAYMGNKEVLLMLDSLMQEVSIVGDIKTINVVSSSSIEGQESYNSALSKRRMAVVESTFRQRYSYIPQDLWNFSYIPENWSGLHKAIAKDASVPNRDMVLSIIDTKEHPDTKEHLLKTLNEGVSWSYIHRNILPLTRGSVSMLFVPIAPTPARTMIPIQRIDPPLIEIPTFKPASPCISRSIISLRTNLLLDLTSTLNIAIELPLAPRWSISAEYVTPWWSSWDNAFTWQIESLYFDLRYWLGARNSYNTLTGWSVGVYAGSGRYDLQPFTNKGVQGEYSDYGVTLSYAHHLGQSRHWLMEYTAGLGYVTTHYRHYYTATDTDEYGNIKVHNYPWSEETLRAPIPTRLGVTLCYLINIKRGGQR